MAERLESRWVISATPFITGDPQPDDDHGHGEFEIAGYLPPQQTLFAGDSLLSAAARGKPLVVAKQFLKDRAGDLGVTAADLSKVVVTDQYTDADTGITHIYLRQKVNGLPVVNANLSVHLTRDNQVIMAGGGFVAGGGSASFAAEQPRADKPGRSATTAIRDAAGFYELQIADTDIKQVKGRADGDLERKQKFRAAGASQDDVPVSLHYVAGPDGLQLAWDVVLRTPGGQNWFNASVDANTGQVIVSNDWVSHATYNVYPLPTEAPHDGPGGVGNRSIVTDPHDPVVSPFGWHDINGIAGAEYTITSGNNVYAYLDRDNSNTPDANGSPDGGAALAFDFPLTLTSAPTLSTNQQSATTNLFYWNNILHDIHARYGFTEAAGNFQIRNYSGQGLGNDAVNAEAQDGGGYNNAYFSSPPDGNKPRMQMYLFNRTSPERDGDIDNQIIVHEYGHGVSNRLTGGPSNANALTLLQSGGMGEGWSDWWGLMLTMKPEDTQSGRYPVGTYVNGQDRDTGAGIRRFPYSYDMSIDPLTFAYYNSDGAKQVHRTGEIWCSALWDMTWLLINKHGFSADISQGYAPAISGRDGGNNLALKLVMEGLKLQPANPSFTQARDAILAADTALTGGANHLQIWTAFARRGLGYTASTSSSNSGIVSLATDLPPGLLNARVESSTPTGAQGVAVSYVELAFSKPMDTASFALAADVVSFTGPGGVDLKPALTSFAWQNNQTLRINFTPQSTDGQYALTVGPQILDAGGVAMDQDIDGTPGEAVQDAYTATFGYDSQVLTVASTSPVSGTLVDIPMTTLDLTFNEPFDPATLSASDLTLSQGSVTAATAVNATTARFTLSLPTYETNVTATLAAGRLLDLGGNPNAAFSGTYTLDYGTRPMKLPMVAQNPLGSLIYAAHDLGVLSIGDTDSFTIDLDAGQTATVTLQPDSAGLQPVATLRGPDGSVISSVTSTAPNVGAFIESAPVAVAGTYTIDVSAAAGEGYYYFSLLLNGVAERQAANDTPSTAVNVDAGFASIGGVNRVGVFGSGNSGDVDHYAVTLAAGEGISASVNSSGSGSVSGLNIVDTAGNLLAGSAIGATNAARVISDFVAPTAGTYVVQVQTSGIVDYGVFLVRDASLDLEPNDTTTAAKMPQAPLVGGVRRVVGGIAAAGDVDRYRVTLAAGTPLLVSTATPADGVGLPVNTLDPRVRLLDSNGTQVAIDDKAAADGRNASLSYLPSVSGTYYVEVSSTTVAATTGEYVLSLQGMTTPPFTVTSASPASGAVKSSDLTTISVFFSDNVLPASVTPSAMTLGGVPATSARLATPTTVEFTFAPITTDGVFTAALAAGALRDFQNTPLEAFSTQYTVDGTPLRVISSSVSDGDVLISGTNQVVLTFSEPVNVNANSSDMALRGILRNVGVSPGYSFDATRTVLTLTFYNLQDDNYTLTLTSGDNAFEDVAGNNLDGEATWPLPAGGSGNGVEGGDFVLKFSIDQPTRAITSISAANPLGSRVHSLAATSGLLHDGADADLFTMNLDADQKLSVVVTPVTPGLRPVVELLAADGAAVLATATAPAADLPVVLQTFPITTFALQNLRVRSADGTLGQYTVNAHLNAALEAENHGGPSNDSLATAQSLDAAFSPLESGGDAALAAVLGQLPGQTGVPVITDGFETGTLGPAWATYSSAATGRIGFYNFYPAANGNHALHMDTSVDGSDVLNEAVWTVDLTGIASPRLGFSHISTNDELTTLPAVFTDHANGDGVSMSADGVTWHRIWDGNSSSTWAFTAIDLTAAAQAAGISLASTMKFKFQQFDNFAWSTDGRGWDDVTILTPAPADDFYSFTATAGQLISVATARTGSTSPGGQTLSLFDAAGTVLTTGVGGATNVDHSITEFAVPADGTYYVGVSGAASVPYQVLVAKSAAFELEANDTLATAKPIPASGVIVGYVSSSPSDYFRMPVVAGSTLTITTATPFAATSGLPNGGYLNPRLDLYDSNDSFVLMDDNGVGDGRNARITYVAPTSGIYKVRMYGYTGYGDYLLTVTGAGGVVIPETPDLLADSDTGVSQTDNITSHNNGSADRKLRFSVAGTTPGATVTLYVGSTPIGSAVATGTTTEVATSGAGAFFDGTYNVVARQTIPGEAESPASQPLSLTIDTIAPNQGSTPLLLTSSDSGVSNTDGITNDTTPTVSIGVPVGSYYRLYQQDTLVSTSYATSTSYTFGVLPQGDYAISVGVVDIAGNESVRSTPLNVTIDTAGPTAAATAPDVIAAGGTSYDVTVVYTDNFQIDAATFDDSDIRVNHLQSGWHYGTLQSVDLPGNGSPRTAVYRFTPPGGAWDVADNGVYTIYTQSSQIRDVAGNAAASVSVGTFTVDLATVPSRPDLVAASDTGRSTIDDLTKLNNASAAEALTFSVPGTTAGWTVTLYADGVAIGSAVATGSTTSVTTDGVTTIADGVSNITARQSRYGGESGDSPALAITIDTVAPSVPETPDLAPGTDTGVSYWDNITAYAAPQFNVLSTERGYLRIRHGNAANPQRSLYVNGAGLYYLSVTTMLFDGTEPVYARAEDDAGNESAESVPLMVTIDRTAPATPTVAPNLQSASDSGVSSDDDITNINTPSFDIVSSGDYHRVVMDGVVTGSLYATGVVFTPAAPIADGPHTFVVRAVDIAGNVSADSPATTVVIDTAGPKITEWQSAATHLRGVGEVGLTMAADGSFVEPRLSGVKTLLLSLSESVLTNNLTVSLWGNGVDNLPLDLSGITHTSELRSVNGNNVLAITLSTALPDFARYLVRVAGLTDVAGNALDVSNGGNTRVFTSLLGDATGDRRVNNTDVGGVISLRGIDPISPLDVYQVRSDMTLDGRINNTDVGGAISVRGRDARIITTPTGD